MSKEFEIQLPNGYKILIDNDEKWGFLVSLINPRDYTVSDTTLSTEQVDSLKSVVNDEPQPAPTNKTIVVGVDGGGGPIPKEFMANQYAPPTSIAPAVVPVPESKELTFEQFSDKLDGMNQRCGSCKYLKDHNHCSKHDVPMSNLAPKCEDWRYFA